MPKQMINDQMAASVLPGLLPFKIHLAVYYCPSSLTTGWKSNWVVDHDNSNRHRQQHLSESHMSSQPDKPATNKAFFSLTENREPCPWSRRHHYLVNKGNHKGVEEQ